MMNILKKLSTGRAEMKQYHEEFHFLFWVLGFFLISTMVLSMYSSYNFYMTFFKTSLDGILLKVITIICLLVLELLTASLLAISFKFLLNKKWLIGLIFMFFSGLFYALSWYSSCEGMADKKYKEVDKSDVLTSYYSKLNDSTFKQYEKHIQLYKDMIVTIKGNPQGWSEHKRKYMTKEQGEQISFWQNKIDQKTKERDLVLYQLNNEKTLKLSTNVDSSKNEAAKYYMIVAALMVLQVIANFGLSFLLYIVDLNNKKIEDRVFDDLNDKVNKMFNKLLNVISLRVEDATDKISLKATKEMENSKKIEPKKIQTNISGFAQNNVKTPANVDSLKGLQEEQGKLNVETLKTPANVEGSEQIEILKKYYYIVSILKRKAHPKQEILSNADCKEIKAEIENDLPKSDPTIRKIHNLMRAVGYDKFDVNGNFKN